MPKTDIDALLDAAVRTTPGTKCSVSTALARLDDDIRAKMIAALADTDRFAGIGLSNAFRQLGHEVGRSAVDRHRRRECKCQ